MSALRGFRAWASRVFGFLRRDEMEARLRDETKFHIDMATQRNMSAGMPEPDAQSAALAAFGARERWRAEARDEYRSRGLDEIGQDVRYAWRNLLRSPSFTFAAITTLALSIGATTAMFSVVNTVLLRELPYPNPERIVVLCERNTSDVPTYCNVLNPGNFVTFKEDAKSLELAGAFREARVAVSGRGSEPYSAQARAVSASVFTILGARASHGRLIISGDDTVGAPNVVVLSDAFWRRQFGGDTSIIGETIQLSAFDYIVVGIAAPDVRLYEPVDIWLPIRFSPTVKSNPGRSLRAIGRLKPGLRVETASQEMAGIAAARAAAFPAINENWTAHVAPLRESLVGSTQRSLWILLGAVGFLLLIACANVANLLLARASVREREVAVRISLGASPWRITRQFLTESLVL